MGGTALRPPAVPEDAQWVEEAGEWRWGVVDAGGGKQGVHRSWRGDGSLREEVAFIDGKGVGSFRRFHPNGQLAGGGELVDGNLEGTFRAFASDAPTPERLQPCCVPPNAWELQSDYHHGQLMAQRWYDRAGQQILESGEPHPPRPPAVPADARYDEASACWLVGQYAAGGRRPVQWRRWTREGILVEEESLENDVRHGVLRRFREPDGVLCLEVRYERGLKHGPFRDGTIAAGVFADPRAAVEEGAFTHDLAVGVWRLRDAAGQVIVERDLGVAADDQILARSPALAAVGGVTADSARHLAGLAQTLRRERRIGEAILAAARSAALAGDATSLRELLAQVTWPRAPAAAEELTARAIEQSGDRLAPLVDALVRGGAVAALFRAIAAAIKGQGSYRAALQIIDAGSLLAGDDHHPGSFVTRSLVNVHLGRPGDALRDIQRLPVEWVDQRAQLGDYLRVIFPTYDFWPARIAVETIFEEYPEAPAQDLEAIRAAVQKYATRLSILRAALLRRCPEGEEAEGEEAEGEEAAGEEAAGEEAAGEEAAGREASGERGAAAAAGAPPWVPPDLSALLPAGPVPLDVSTFEQSFAPAQAGGEPGAELPAELAGDAAGGPGDPPAEPVVETIAIDEGLSLEGATIPSLQRLARRDWAALTWLCWSCGLDGVALPRALAPPAAFGRAAGMSIERVWRCQDKLTSGGLVALTKGVPGFEWEGMPIDGMARVLVEVMAEEHLEVRAMFLWLCDGTARSPWQSDLRDVD